MNKATTVRQIDSSEFDRWNEFVSAYPGHVFHSTAWDDVFSFYKLRVTRLVAEEGDEIVGVLPLVRQKSLMFGSHLVSLPWFDATGVLARDTAIIGKLVESAKSMATEKRIPSLQLRQKEECCDSDDVRTDKLLLKLKLQPDPMDLWNGFSAKVRNQVRKAEKNGLTAEIGGRELLDTFFRIYSHNMRDLGSPSHHRSFFHRIFDHFGDESKVIVVQKEGVPVGAGLTIDNGPAVEIPWASSLRDYNSFCVNHLMYWTLIEQACRDGYAWFHFGRSTRDSGPYRFKKQWGPEEDQLYWYFYEKSGQSDSENSAAEKSAAEGSAAEKAEGAKERFGLGIRVWRRLPLWLTRRLGPMFIANIP